MRLAGSSLASFPSATSAISCFGAGVLGWSEAPPRFVSIDNVSGKGCALRVPPWPPSPPRPPRSPVSVPGCWDGRRHRLASCRSTMFPGKDAPCGFLLGLRPLHDLRDLLFRCRGVAMVGGAASLRVDRQSFRERMRLAGSSLASFPSATSATSCFGAGVLGWSEAPPRFVSIDKVSGKGCALRVPPWPPSPPRPPRPPVSVPGCWDGRRHRLASCRSTMFPGKDAPCGFLLGLRPLRDLCDLLFRCRSVGMVGGAASLRVDRQYFRERMRLAGSSLAPFPSATSATSCFGAGVLGWSEAPPRFVSIDKVSGKGCAPRVPPWPPSPPRPPRPPVSVPGCWDGRRRRLASCRSTMFPGKDAPCGFLLGPLPLRDLCDLLFRCRSVGMVGGAASLRVDRQSFRERMRPAGSSLASVPSATSATSCFGAGVLGWSEAPPRFVSIDNVSGKGCASRFPPWPPSPPRPPRPPVSVPGCCDGRRRRLASCRSTKFPGKDAPRGFLFGLLPLRDLRDLLFRCRGVGMVGGTASLRVDRQSFRERMRLAGSSLASFPSATSAISCFGAGVLGWSEAPPRFVSIDNVSGKGCALRVPPWPPSPPRPPRPPVSVPACCDGRRRRLASCRSTMFPGKDAPCGFLLGLRPLHDLRDLLFRCRGVAMVGGAASLRVDRQSFRERMRLAGSSLASFPSATSAISCFGAGVLRWSEAPPRFVSIDKVSGKGCASRVPPWPPSPPRPPRPPVSVPGCWDGRRRRLASCRSTKFPGKDAPRGFLLGLRPLRDLRDLLFRCRGVGMVGGAASLRVDRQSFRERMRLAGSSLASVPSATSAISCFGAGVLGWSEAPPRFVSIDKVSGKGCASRVPPWPPSPPRPPRPPVSVPGCWDGRRHRLASCRSTMFPGKDAPRGFLFGLRPLRDLDSVSLHALHGLRVFSRSEAGESQPARREHSCVRLSVSGARRCRSGRRIRDCSCRRGTLHHSRCWRRTRKAFSPVSSNRNGGRSCLSSRWTSRGSRCPAHISHNEIRKLAWEENGGGAGKTQVPGRKRAGHEAVDAGGLTADVAGGGNRV